MDNVTAPIMVMTAQWIDIGSNKENPSMMPVGTIENLMFTDLIIHAHAGPTLQWDSMGHPNRICPFCQACQEHQFSGYYYQSQKTG